MLKTLAIVAIMNVGVLAFTQKPLPMKRDNQHQQSEHKSEEPEPNAKAIVAAEVDKENTENAERYAYYETHPKEYIKAAIAPANLSNWILAALGAIGGILALATLLTLKRQTGHVVTSERAWMVASLKTDNKSLAIGKTKDASPIGVRFSIKNEGKTHAFIIEIGGAVKVLETGNRLPKKAPPYDPANVVRWGGNGIPIPAHQTFARYAVETCENSAGVLNGSHVLWAYGYVRYTDVFRDRTIFFRRKIRETRYCFRFQHARLSIGVPDHFAIEGPETYNRAT
jgi:hypothetical protein